MLDLDWRRLAVERILVSVNSLAGVTETPA
jgi:hypothetical protein